jgi:hypothetical protein
MMKHHRVGSGPTTISSRRGIGGRAAGTATARPRLRAAARTLPRHRRRPPVSSPAPPCHPAPAGSRATRRLHRIAWPLSSGSIAAKHLGADLHARDAS